MREGPPTERPEFAKNERAESRTLPEVLTGQETADLVEQLYDAAPDRFRVHLVESNIVLTLAGLKPQTEFFLTLRNEDEREGTKALVKEWNRVLRVSHPYLRVALAEEPYLDNEGRRTQMIAVENLVALERRTKATLLPGVPPYDARTGWPGAAAWEQRARDALRAAQQSGSYDASFDLENILIGVSRGYPDQAILDFTDWDAKSRTRRVDTAVIAFSRTYRAALPDLDYYREHADDPDIQRYLTDSAMVLEKFYESPWHQRLRTDPTFQRDRLDVDEERSS